MASVGKFTLIEVSTVKRLSIVLMSALLIAATGCGRSGTQGGPGATDPTAKAPLIGQKDDTFNLTVSSVSLKQGDSTQGMIGIKRGTNFEQDVTLAFTDLPKGVTIDPAGPAILSKGTEAKFTFKVGDDAALGDFTVKVVGHPAKGGDATNQFNLTIAKKDSFTLSVPFWTTAVKQGETKAVSITISRDKQFDQDVALKFNDLPKGVTVEPVGAVIKNGETEAKFVLKAAEDAAIGGFTTVITGHPSKGADVTHEFKFNVAKK
jgi:hypothetical protein